MIKAIIFDYDGVLVDSLPSTHQIYKVICEELGKTWPQDFAVFQKMFIGCYKQGCYSLGFTPNDLPAIGKIYHRELLRADPPLYQGIKPVIEALAKQFHLTIVSANSQIAVLNKLQKEGLQPHFTHVLGYTDKVGALPKGPAFHKIAANIGLQKDEIVIIGDRKIDYDEAMEAGFPHILLVEYGWGYNKAEIPQYNQKMMIHTPRDIVTAMEVINNGHKIQESCL